jgi:hypothetical protein
MNKRRTWKFSTGGGVLFVIALFAPFLLALASLLVRRGIQRWTDAVGAVVFVMVAFIWFAGVRILVADRLWRLPRTWFEAAFSLAALYAFYALFIFVTGYTPTKYGSHPVPRAAGFIWVYRAFVPFLVGVGAYALERRKPNGRSVRPP